MAEDNRDAIILQYRALLTAQSALHSAWTGRNHDKAATALAQLLAADAELIRLGEREVSRG